LGKDNIRASKLVLCLWFRKSSLKIYATSFDMFTLYTPMLNLIFQKQLPTTYFWQQWYFFAPWWWCWIGGVLVWISMAMVNFSTWDYLWTRRFNIVPWSNSLLFNINNIFNCISKRYIILNFYSLAPPWFKKISTFLFCPIGHYFWKQSIVVGLHSICCGWSTRFKAWSFSCVLQIHTCKPIFV